MDKIFSETPKHSSRLLAEEIGTLLDPEDEQEYESLRQAYIHEHEKSCRNCKTALGLSTVVSCLMFAGIFLLAGMESEESMVRRAIVTLFVGALTIPLITAVVVAILEPKTAKRSFDSWVWKKFGAEPASAPQGIVRSLLGIPGFILDLVGLSSWRRPLGTLVWILLSIVLLMSAKTLGQVLVEWMKNK